MQLGRAHFAPTSGSEAHAANGAVLEMGGVRVSRVGTWSMRGGSGELGHASVTGQQPELASAFYCTIGPVATVAGIGPVFLGLGNCDLEIV